MQSKPVVVVSRLFVVSFAAALLLPSAGCGLFGGSSEPAKQPMTSSASNITGEGTVQAKKGDNGNTDVEVRVKHLAIPSKVAADASVYVVWIQPRNAAIQNVGALMVDGDLVGKLDTTTPFLAFTLTVTPEPSARMAAPTHEAVFSASVERAD